MDKFQANDIINDLSDDEIARLKEARDGYRYDRDDKATQKLLDAGYVNMVRFEYVHAKNSIDGITTSADGDKLLQELDNRPVVETKEQHILQDGEAIKTTSVEVKDPQPASNIRKEDFRPKPEKVAAADPKKLVNPGDVGTAAETEKSDEQKRADKDAARK